MIKIDENDPVGELDPSFPFRDVVIKKNTDVKKFYDLQKEIGRGKFGTVYKCRERSTGLKLAAKFISIAKRQDRRNAEREVEIMRELQHPRLIQMYDAYEMNNVMCVVLELIEGGELFERVIDDDFVLTEKSVSVFMRQICEGVAFIHSKNILHLDMKPENILCLTRDGNRIKIIDFGLARKYDPEKKLQVLFGTPEFVAPEVVNFESIGFGTDMWSVGVICYVLLSGLSPFMGETDVATMANVTIAQYDFDDEAFNDISKDAQDFISKLLIKDRETRMSATDCLSHPWLERPPIPVVVTSKINGAVAAADASRNELDLQKDTLRGIVDRWNCDVGSNGVDDKIIELAETTAKRKPSKSKNSTAVDSPAAKNGPTKRKTSLTNGNGPTAPPPSRKKEVDKMMLMTKGVVTGLVSGFEPKNTANRPKTVAKGAERRPNSDAARKANGFGDRRLNGQPTAAQTAAKNGDEAPAKRRPKMDAAVDGDTTAATQPNVTESGGRSTSTHADHDDADALSASATSVARRPSVRTAAVRVESGDGGGAADNLGPNNETSPQVPTENSPHSQRPLASNRRTVTSDADDTSSSSHNSSPPGSGVQSDDGDKRIVAESTRMNAKTAVVDSVRTRTRPQPHNLDPDDDASKLPVVTARTDVAANVNGHANATVGKSGDSVPAAYSPDSTRKCGSKITSNPSSGSAVDGSSPPKCPPPQPPLTPSTDDAHVHAPAVTAKAATSTAETNASKTTSSTIVGQSSVDALSPQYTSSSSRVRKNSANAGTESSPESARRSATNVANGAAALSNARISSTVSDAAASKGVVSHDDHDDRDDRGDNACQRTRKRNFVIQNMIENYEQKAQQANADDARRPARISVDHLLDGDSLVDFIDGPRLTQRRISDITSLLSHRDCVTRSIDEMKALCSNLSHIMRMRQDSVSEADAKCASKRPKFRISYFSRDVPLINAASSAAPSTCHPNLFGYVPWAADGRPSSVDWIGGVGADGRSNAHSDPGSLRSSPEPLAPPSLTRKILSKFFNNSIEYAMANVVPPATHTAPKDNVTEIVS